MSQAEVLKVLKKSSKPLSAEDIVRKIKGKSLGTIRLNLTKLARREEVKFTLKQMMYEGKKRQHFVNRRFYFL